MTTKAATKTEYQFPHYIEVSELEAIAAAKGAYKEEVAIEGDMKVKYRDSHSKAVQVLNTKLEKARDLAKAIKSGFGIDVEGSGIDSINRLLTLMVNQSTMVDADYLSLTGSEIEEILPASNKMLFEAAIYNYVPEMDVKELKQLANKLEQELNEGFFVTEHQNAFLIVAQSRGLQAWYTSTGVLIESMDIEAKNKGKVFSNSAESLLQAA